MKAIVQGRVQRLAKIGYLRQTVWMTLGGVAQRAVWVLLPILLSRLLPADGLSGYLVMQNLLICLSVVTAVGMPTVLLRAVAAHAEPLARWQLMQSASRLLIRIASALLLLAMATASWMHLNGLALPYGLPPLAWLAGLFATVTAGWLAAAQAYVQGLGQPRVVVQFQAGSALALMLGVPVAAALQGLEACLLAIGLAQTVEIYRLQRHVRQFLRSELRPVVAQSLLRPASGLGSREGMLTDQAASAVQGQAEPGTSALAGQALVRLAMPAWMSAMLVAPAHVLIIGWVGHQLGEVRQAAAMSVAIGWLAAVMMVPIFAGRSLLAALAAAPSENLVATVRQAMLWVGALAVAASAMVYLGLQIGPAWYGALTPAVVHQTTPVLLAGVLASWATVLGAALSAFGREGAGFVGNLIWLVIYVVGVYLLMGQQGVAVSWSLVAAYAVLVLVSAAQLSWVVRRDPRCHRRAASATRSEPA